MIVPHEGTRWAPTIVINRVQKHVINPYKLAYKWITGVIFHPYKPISGVITLHTLLITGSGAHLVETTTMSFLHRSVCEPNPTSNFGPEMLDRSLLMVNDGRRVLGGFINNNWVALM